LWHLPKFLGLKAFHHGGYTNRWWTLQTNLKKNKMKTLITILFTCISLLLYSQDYYGYEINFEDTTQYFRIELDSLNSSTNIWQIGKPQKAILDSARSPQNVIITDTLVPYPTNDTSSFTITHIAGAGIEDEHTVVLAGYYFVDSDTLSDYGLIEFSPDNGSTWVDLINDTIVSGQWGVFYWGQYRPILTGSSNGWQYFWINIAFLAPHFNIARGDTMLYRFTFISDSLQTNKGGLMYDDLFFEDMTESIVRFNVPSFKSTCTPNPARHQMRLKTELLNNEELNLVIYDRLGQVVYSENQIRTSDIEVDLSLFAEGAYYYKLETDNPRMISTGKFIKIK
jgi:hypothetical protein